jgi:hypothetical protein
MARVWCGLWASLLLTVGLVGCQREPGTNALAVAQAESFLGSKAGDEREVVGVKLCWCPPGKFLMGSPPNEPERRPDEDQVEVTLTKGFWTAKYETTQGLWKRVVGKLPGPLTAELPEGEDYPVGNVNFAEAEEFCQKLTRLARQSGNLPNDWEFRLPTEAQWEYACRAGTTTATSFGDTLSSKQANFKGQPYNGAEAGPSLGHAQPSAATRPTPGGCTTCTATPSSGAETGTTPSSPAVSIRTYTLPKPRHACAGADAGLTRGGRAGPRFACGLNPSVVTTTSASASSPFDFRQQSGGSEPAQSHG